MCHGRDVTHDWVRQLDTSPSTSHWTVEVYVTKEQYSGIHTCQGNVIHIIYRCMYTYKYIGHELETGWGGVDVDRHTVGVVDRGSSGRWL